MKSEGRPYEPPVADDALCRPKCALLSSKRVMVLGDSITQHGLYVSFLEYFLPKAYPGKTFDIISVGLASETVSGLSEAGHAGGAFPRPCLHERLRRALDAVRPRLVIACYGINDGIYEPYSALTMKAFQDGMTRLVEMCRAMNAAVILVTPPMFDFRTVQGWFADPDYDLTLGKFAEWEVKNRPAGVVAVVDLHSDMNAALAERQVSNPGFHFSDDGVHPGILGHLIMAVSILAGLGVPIPGGSAESLLTAVSADPMFELVCRRRAVRSDGWLNFIGYTRERRCEPGSVDIDAVEAEAMGIQREIDVLKRKPLAGTAT